MAGWRLVAGVGVADDHSAGFLAIALVIGTLLSGGRRIIFNRWFAAGAAIAVAFEIPDLWWQAQHQWATIAMTHALNQEHGGLGNIGTFVIGQLGLVTAGPGLGLRVVGLKTYYLAAAYVYLLAAGAVAIDGWLQARPSRLRTLMLATALRRLPEPVLHQRAGGGHAVESG